ncbi:MAG: hypothetical protein OEO23_07975 [Gemmatimonadota bacterium]|nr:hypothetical protein [Gemmatimonadota bacterium]
MQAGEQIHRSSWTAPEQLDESTEVLYLRYHAYRHRQAAKLLHVMPREAVRELYAEARSWARGRDLHDGRDPMATLHRYTLEILPLPPFDVWLQDRRHHPVAHLEEYSDDPHAPPVGRPGRIQSRKFLHQGREWLAALFVFREDDAWRGFVEFEEAAGGPGYKTANIFREEAAGSVEKRFLEFDEKALTAFLLSALP